MTSEGLFDRCSDYQPKPEAALPLYSHFQVSSSVHPGTAKRVGAVTRWPGRTVTRWRERKWLSRNLERCTVAALADAHKINRPKTRTDRIAFAPFGLPTEPLTSPNIRDLPAQPEAGTPR